MKLNYYLPILLLACSVSQNLNAANELDVKTGKILQLVGNPLPKPGLVRPLFHVTQNTTTGIRGLTPAQVKHFYGFDQLNTAAPGAGQVIAIIDAYDDPNIEADLKMFNTTFNLPQCTSANSCFKKIYATGIKPATNSGWAVEIALDVEWAHAIAPAAKIMLVEAASSSFDDMIKAVDVAVMNGATVVSMSFGSGEFWGENSYDSHFIAGKNANVIFVASAGDSGHGVEYPAASPYVISVGGTTMHTADANGKYAAETAWSGGGGGESFYEYEPVGQANFKLPINAAGYRGVPDVAYGADPNIGFAIYNSLAVSGQQGWLQIGGTSAGAPQWAAFFAIANSMHSQSPNPNTTLYNLSKTSSVYNIAFHDITLGTNGYCGVICSATKGYDYVTGLGSPNVKALATDY